jgi:hypothetical protein
MKQILLFLTTISLLLFGCSQSDLGDWRKGSSATLQATISLDNQAFKNSTLNDSIHVYSSGDYKQCIKDVVVNPPWLTPDHDVIATCSSTSSGGVGLVNHQILNLNL